MRQLKFSLSDNENVIRTFGDSSRAKNELSARRAGMSRHFAWNAELTYADDPIDGDDVRVDGSYISSIFGNWIVTIGAVEKWWGPSWSSNNILSNNARPPVGLSFQRNYSDQADSSGLQWIGPWTFNAFVSELNDERGKANSKLIGASLTLKPIESVEVGLRSTQVSTEDKKVEAFDSSLDVALSNRICVSEMKINPQECLRYFDESSRQISGLDFRWKLPFQIPVALYGSSYSNSKLFSTNSINQVGLTSSLKIGLTRVKWYMDVSDKKRFNETNNSLENSFTELGFRYNNLSLGSTFDDFTSVVSLGLIATIDKTNQISLHFTKGRDILHIPAFREGIENNSSSKRKSDLTALKLIWKINTDKGGTFNISLESSDFESLVNRNEARIDWNYLLNN
ncbi:capsule assembly Wzi family protein [Aliikangiella marina]|uniref:capsule assembly Wzi family protein n=1 Tax=Aliikangiella marina TaxID=1712262 RepID=UPI00163DD3A7|nr:capsule assembly Wzi family protein [Aliikangiella marina]